jgi:two-component system chemotaxis response regulator CheY
VAQVTTVLIIEDDKGVRRMLRFAMREAGFDVVEAANGIEGLALLDAHGVDAVVLDLALPGESQAAMLHRLRVHRRDRRRPVWLAVTALEAREAEFTFGNLDGRLIAKPYDPWHVISSLKVMLTQLDRGFST